MGDLRSRRPFWASSSSLFLVAAAAFIAGAGPGTLAIRCWQCASIEGKSCPQDATLVESKDHDACTTWQVANGTVLLQNVVRHHEECSPQKVLFWSSFIDLYYKARGGIVKCCRGDACNLMVAPLVVASPSPPPPLPQFDLRPLHASAGVNLRPHHQFFQVQQQGQLPVGLLASAGYDVVQGSPTFGPTAPGPGFQQGHVPIYGGVSSNARPFGLGGALTLDNKYAGRKGNCQKYFDKVQANEWMPRIIVPLTYDRASETKVAVFYANLKDDLSSSSGGSGGVNDHIVVRLINDDKSNMTMYTFKLNRVGTVSLHISRLRPANNGFQVHDDGHHHQHQQVSNFDQYEVRKESVQHAVNISGDDYAGFWITVNEEELALGKIGQPLVKPLLLWNDTLREGPRNPYYFGLTTAELSSASFGINCDVPGLHFPDTCVEDRDCSGLPNMACSRFPLNWGLDSGAREQPFELWAPRDTLLKSCFCRKGHLRIPGSQGCYDPIRRVVTLKDACFSDDHCNDLPNTYCKFDASVPKFNHSCDCMNGYKPFKPDPKTQLVEGCAPLTEEDRYSILGCDVRFSVLHGSQVEWVPEITHPTFRGDADKDGSTASGDAADGADTATVHIRMNLLDADGDDGSYVVLRMLDSYRSRRKMLSVRFRSDGLISILESTITSSFFFESERESERASVRDPELVDLVKKDYVGFWIMYRYEGSNGQLSLGLNDDRQGATAAFSPDYALIKWTDTSDTVMRSVKYVGFTTSRGAGASFGTECKVRKRTPVVSGLPAAAASAATAVPASDHDLQLLQDVVGLPQYGHQHHQHPYLYSAYAGVPEGPEVALLDQLHRASQEVSSLGTSSAAAAAAAAGGASTDPDSSGEALNQADGLAEQGDDPPVVVVQPEIRNQFLTRLKKLLPPTLTSTDIDSIRKAIRGRRRDRSEDLAVTLDEDHHPTAAAAAAAAKHLVHEGDLGGSDRDDLAVAPDTT